MTSQRNSVSEPHHQHDSWASGSPYERFMGRWSMLIGREFLKWLAIPPGCSWLDVGCGTGTLTRLVLQTNQPSRVVAIDTSSEFVSYAANTLANPLVRFQVGQAQSLELETDSVDVAVSGLMLNFVGYPDQAVSEMQRVTQPGGIIGIYLWDYADGMGMLRYFWDAAVELDQSARELDEGVRFPLCHRGQFASLAETVGLQQVEAAAIEVATVFQNFDDYWRPFLGAVGPAPSYVQSLSTINRQRLEDRLRETLPANDDGAISMTAKAWAIKGIV